MEYPIKKVVSSLEKREDAIIALDKKCHKLSRLARTLLNALESSINHSEMSYDDKQMLKTETKDLSKFLTDSSPVLAASEQDDQY